MTIDASHSKLREIGVELVERNPDNPRILFRQSEMDVLLESIRLYGVQVPVSVYRDGNRYVLIDGERRWRCCLKLNKKTIPALVQEKPTPLTNLLLMFNIHSLREQWDLLTIAMKLPRVIELLHKEKGITPSERDIASKTGLAPGLIRRCKLLIDLPEKYKSIILRELDKPKPQQKLTEDFFIEMERALKTVERKMPEALTDRERVREVLIEKYKRGTIVNILQFRKIPKIARAENVEADRAKASSVLERLFTNNDYSIENAYDDSVSDAYLERDLKARIDFIVRALKTLPIDEIDEEIRNKLELLVSSAVDLLRRVR